MIMKKNLLKTMLLGLLTMVGMNAWADNTVRYSTDGGTTWTDAADLNALNGSGNIFGTATSDVQVQVLADQTISSRITWGKAFTLTITPTTNITIKGPTGAMWFLANVNDAKIVMGSPTYSITFDGENKTHTSGDITRREKNGSVSLINVKFKDFDLNSACHLCSSKAEGSASGLILEDVTIENCINPETAYIYSDRVVNDVILLKGYLNVDEQSTGATIFTKLETKDSGTAGRIKIDDSSAALTVSRPITITFAEQSTTLKPKIGAAIVINSTNNFTDATAANFVLLNADYGTYRNNKDIKLTQAYTVSVTDAGAATLILPFESTIPTGVTAYSVTYSGGDKVTAEEITATALGANKAVLVNAAEGDYKFVSTTKTAGDLVVGSGTHVNGALTGVYASTTVANTSYILTTSGGNVGFMLSDGTATVEAYHAYLTAASGTRSLDISYGGTTGIQSMKVAAEDDIYYDLQGRRVLYPKKGLYIVNGKKVIIK